MMLENEELDQDLLLLVASVWGISFIVLKALFIMLMRHPIIIKYLISKFKKKEKAMKQDYVELIKAACLKYKLDPDLFCAIVNTESAWDSKAIRYERDFIYLWNPAKYAASLNISEDTEKALQKMSYGLCQIMGANARWMGFEEPLMNLMDPQKNIDLGVAFFKKRCDVYPSTKDKISSYNAGSPIKKDDVYLNQGYVDKVYSYYMGLKAPKK